MPKTLDKPVQRASRSEREATCKTPFKEQTGGACRATLGNPRWQTVPAVPSRSRAQEVVDDIERVKAEGLLAEYRRQEAVKALHDIASRREAIERLERGRDYAGAEAVRREIAKCDHQEFLVAQSALRELEADAAALVVPILERLVTSFDGELSSYALGREDDLRRFAIPLSRTETVVESSSLSSAGAQFINGHESVVWELHSDKGCTILHSCREVVRNLLQKFTKGMGSYSRGEVLSMFAIATLTFLATDEPTSFGWL